MRLGRDLAIAALIGAMSVPFAPGLARAESASEAVTRQLEDYGYHGIDVQRTLLGRVRITGTRAGVEREIVLDPRSGEILRDLSRSSRRPILNDTPLGGNGSSSYAGQGATSGRDGSDDGSDDGGSDSDSGSDSGSSAGSDDGGSHDSGSDDGGGSDGGGDSADD